MPFLIVLVLWLVFAISWCTNLYDVTQCDFQSPYKCEAVHTIGVFIPPASLVTVWFDTDPEPDLKK